MGYDAQQIVGVAGVLRDAEGRILLVKTPKVGWELPGGKVERGEDLIAALKREVREEASCEIEVGRLAGVTSHVGEPATTILTFHCRHINGKAQAGSEALEADWFDADRAVELVIHPIERMRLVDALANERHVVYKAYRLVGDWRQTDGYEMLCRQDC